MFTFLETPSFALMRKQLDALWLRESVITENIANIDTPRYKAKRVLFESILDDKLKSMKKFGNFTRSDREGVIRLINSVEPEIVTDKRTEARADGNNVSIDGENIELTRTKLQYDYMIRKLSNEYSLLKKAINEGKG